MLSGSSSRIATELDRDSRNLQFNMLFKINVVMVERAIPNRASWCHWRQVDREQRLPREVARAPTQKSVAILHRAL